MISASPDPLVSNDGSDVIDSWIFKKENLKEVTMERLVFLDNGGRRSGSARRQFSLVMHIPDGRSAVDRRSGIDRRVSLRSLGKEYIFKEHESRVTIGHAIP